LRRTGHVVAKNHRAANASHDQDRHDPKADGPKARALKADDLKSPDPKGHGPKRHDPKADARIATAPDRAKRQPGRPAAVRREACPAMTTRLGWMTTSI
jgi:hypothetical protein